MDAITVRAGEREDIPLIFHFIRELAIYERALHEVTTDEAMLEAALFDGRPSAFSLICEKDSEPVGFAIYFYSFSTWLGQYGLFLEDLYIAPEHRGSGAGSALLQYLAKLAVERGCGRFEWNVLDWNVPAIRFYESLGATPQSEWRGYRLSGQALAALAEGQSNRPGGETDRHA